MKKIKKNDLIPFFIMDHDDLPESYLKHCEKFFGMIRQQIKKKGKNDTKRHNRASKNN